MRMYVNLCKKWVVLQSVVSVVTSVEVGCCSGHQILKILFCFCHFSLLWLFLLSCPSRGVCLLWLFQLKTTVTLEAWSVIVGCGTLSCLIRYQTSECAVGLCLRGLAFTRVSTPTLEVEIFPVSSILFPLVAAGNHSVLIQYSSGFLLHRMSLFKI